MKTIDDAYDSIMEACDKSDPAPLKKSIDWLFEAFPSRHAEIAAVFNRREIMIRDMLNKGVPVLSKWKAFHDLFQLPDFDELRKLFYLK